MEAKKPNQQLWQQLQPQLIHKCLPLREVVEVVVEERLVGDEVAVEVVEVEEVSPTPIAKTPTKTGEQLQKGPRKSQKRSL